MENVWIEWKGYGIPTVGKVTVKFRDNEIVEDEHAGHWNWNWVTGDRPSEIIAYKVLTDKKPKIERKRPEFTFEDGRYFNFYLERGGPNSDISNLCVFCQIAGDSTGLLNKDRILYIIKLVERALRESSEICSQWEHKPLRKKLKLYVKWLQSELSKLESSK